MVTSLGICVRQKWELSAKRASLPLMVVQATLKQQSLKFPASSNASTMCKSYNTCSIAYYHFWSSKWPYQSSLLKKESIFLTQFLTLSAFFTVRNTRRVSAHLSTRLHSLAWSRVWTVGALTINAKVCSKTSPIANSDQFGEGRWDTLGMFYFSQTRFI